MQFLTRKVQRLVSGHRNRFVDDEFDLDLTYITDRIMAMGFPGEGVVGLYRNDSTQIARFLKQRYGSSFMIWNLSQFKYDYEKFDNQVLEFGFPDHHSPPLDLLFAMCKSIHSWLTADEKHVISVHCLAGKGRTGTLIASYLLYSGQFKSAQDALDYFASKRSSHLDLSLGGVTIPSQRRYVQYFDDVLAGRKDPTPKSLWLRKVYFHNLPVEYRSKEISFLLNIFEMVSLGPNNVQKKSIYSSNEDGLSKNLFADADGFCSIHCNIRVKGDILVKCQRINSLGKEGMFRFSFHTAFVPLGVLRLTKYDLDEANKDKKFTSDFMLDLFFEEPLEAETSVGAEGSSSSERSAWDLLKEHHEIDKARTGAGVPFASKKSTYLTEPLQQTTEGKIGEESMICDMDFNGPVSHT